MTCVLLIKCGRWNSKEENHDMKKNLFVRALDGFALLFSYLLLFPAVVLVRIFSPLVKVRFGGLISGRIGHFAMNTEMYLCQRDVEGSNGRVIDLFYNDRKVCNRQLEKMWRRVLHVSPVFGLIDRTNRILPGWERHVIETSAADPDGLLTQCRAHLSFTAEEETRGMEAFRMMGMPAGAPFICFYCRDSAYLGKAFPGHDWIYHDYRNSDINNYIAAAKEMTRRGYFTLRMGAIVEIPLNTDEPKVIDYSARYRSDFLDVYLSSKCRFFITDTGGLSSLPKMFRTPLVVVNHPRLSVMSTNFYSSQDLFIPKKVWIKADGRFMTFREVHDSGIGLFLQTEQFERLGVELVENTPEEITALAIEMDDRLNGIWETTPEDEELQEEFQLIFRRADSCKEGTRIGAHFLRENRDLLG